MKREKSVEEIMRIKMKMLREHLDRLPLGDPLCYFCQKGKCKNCEYGKVHGICYKDSSHYSFVMRTLGFFRDVLERFYYKNGEVYKS